MHLLLSALALLPTLISATTTSVTTIGTPTTFPYETTAIFPLFFPDEVHGAIITQAPNRTEYVLDCLESSSPVPGCSGLFYTLAVIRSTLVTAVATGTPMESGPLADVSISIKCTRLKGVTQGDLCTVQGSGVDQSGKETLFSTEVVAETRDLWFHVTGTQVQAVNTESETLSTSPSMSAAQSESGKMAAGKAGLVFGVVVGIVNTIV
ncbi:hypothetical protein OQA88_10910 [Cercophora sp. LCS_1]